MSTPSPSSSASSSTSQPPQYRIIGVLLAVGSGLLIGSSFVFKKKGLLSSQNGHAAGEGVAYLKSPMWWTGMIIMILGELCNFAAYAFVEAIIVTPMGALSVVISALLSHFVLGEKLSLFGWISSIQCLLGASILALNGPEEQSVNTIVEFRKLFVTTLFLAYGGGVLALALVLAVFVAPRWGHKSMLPYLGVCSLIGGLSVSCTQGLGACILTSIRGNNQFKNWFIYFLLIFVIITLLTEIYYLNVALALYNTAMVTPTYYVTFTFCTLVTSVILYQGLKASASQIVTIVLAFAVICTGIIILQMSKVDPRTLSNVDERTTLLLEAARREVDPHAGRSLELQRLSTLRSRRSRPSTALARSTTSNRSVNLPSSTHGMIVASPIEGSFSIPNEDFDVDEHRAIVEKTEEPGLDSLRGFAGAFGTIIRTRRRTREFSAISALRSNEPSEVGDPPSQDILRSVSSRSSSSMRHTNWFRGVWSSPRESQFQIMPKNGGDLEKNGGRVLEIEDMREEGPRNVVICTRHIDSHGSTRSRVLPAAGATPLDISTVHPTFRTAHSEPLIQTTSRIHFEEMQTTSAPVVPGSDIVSKFREGMT